jgi:hypothetical protein
MSDSTTLPLTIINQRGHLFKRTSDSSTYERVDAPPLQYSKIVDSRYAITQGDGRLYDTHTNQFLDVQESEFKSVFYVGRLFALRENGDLYTGIIDDDFELKDWKMFMRDVQFITPTQGVIVQPCNDRMKDCKGDSLPNANYFEQSITALQNGKITLITAYLRVLVSSMADKRLVIIHVAPGIIITSNGILSRGLGSPDYKQYFNERYFNGNTIAVGFDGNVTTIFINKTEFGVEFQSFHKDRLHPLNRNPDHITGQRGFDGVRGIDGVCGIPGVVDVEYERRRIRHSDSIHYSVNKINDEDEIVDLIVMNNNLNLLTKSGAIHKLNENGKTDKIEIPRELMSTPINMKSARNKMI